ncbi:nucleotide sugar dehydrogenase [Egibacter rhizosphaerae]|uniref:Nucleotide sugar dehydrogenase n=1 Tax=Egibacter rhizosphaerae TaxID=1670831 RepID=A0A411YHE7_9ACTN|nr:nucleotide sugar dehydrogenase [Egibacter rhizosphaerae]QBI20684.1 nucleotide sugar dehydrogenase [Egibacter rhizosphaerae]
MDHTSPSGSSATASDPASAGWSSEVTDRAAHFRERPWTAGVIGLGYVGLPLAVTAAQKGLACVGFDVSDAVVERLKGGTSHIGDVTHGELVEALDSGLEVTSDPSRLVDADTIFIAVPSPLGRNRQPDMSYIEAAADTVREVARPGQLITLESTTYPGTTDEIILPAATAKGLELDRDVFVAFSPERVDPGNQRSTGEIPKVVGGVTPASGAVAEAAYRRLVPAVHLVSNARAAEMTKLLENTYRAVNIGLVNELAQLSHELDIDVWEVIDAADTKPFGFQAFYPGPGVGGHCIPLDPQFLAWRAREAKFATRFIDLAEQVNTRMPAYNADRVAELLNRHGRPVWGTRILGVGVAYKPNVADDRESPAWDVLSELAARGGDIGVLDPLIEPERIAAQGYRTVGHSRDEIADHALAVVLTDHDAIDLAELADAVPAVFDTRGAYRKRGIDAPNVTAL